MKREKGDYLIKSVGYALDILELFKKENGKLDRTVLSRRLGIDGAHVDKLLATLEERHYLSRARHTDQYHLGEKNLELFHTFLRHLDLRKTALPVLERLLVAGGETCFLAKPERDFLVYLEVLEGGAPCGWRWTAGAGLPCATAPPARRFWRPPMGRRASPAPEQVTTRRRTEAARRGVPP